MWKKFVADHKWSQKLSVGKFTHEVAKDNAELAATALEKQPVVKGVLAPYDEVTKGTVEGIARNRLSAAVTRTLALQLSGQLGEREVVFPGVLVTQSFLVEQASRT